VINKIEGIGSTRSPTSVRRASRTGDGGDSFAKQLDDLSEVDDAEAVVVASSLGLVTGVVGLQEVDDALLKSSKGKRRAESILDQLENIRLELLAGTLSRDMLLKLVQMVKSRRERIVDQRLNQILDEIDLRAQVELAKYIYADSQL
jgi:hypothetical protein